MIRQEFFAQRTIRRCLLSNVRLRTSKGQSQWHTLLRNLRRMHGPQRARRRQRVAGASWFETRNSLARKSSHVVDLLLVPRAYLNFGSCRGNGKIERPESSEWASASPKTIVEVYYLARSLRNLHQQMS